MSKRILVVEDQEDNRQILRDLLGSTGYEMVEAENGEDALTVAAAEQPDLILMDIQLHDVSGLEVTRRLRGDDRCKRIPIIAVTAMGWHEREALDSGCDAYISKPITILGFLRTVESFLGGAFLASSLQLR